MCVAGQAAGSAEAVVRLACERQSEPLLAAASCANGGQSLRQLLARHRARCYQPGCMCCDMTTD
jgi:hypothetical protein